MFSSTVIESKSALPWNTVPISDRKLCFSSRPILLMSLPSNKTVSYTHLDVYKRQVAVYSGILPITQSDAGLAVVLGHEISHALAGHGNERISQAMVAQGVGGIVGGVLTSGQMAQIFQQVYPIGAQVALLKYGRNQELEADEMGLYLMSMAGYDPRQAQPFWQRMEASSNGNRPPEFLSTHPNPDTRRSDLEKHMPCLLYTSRCV